MFKNNFNYIFLEEKSFTFQLANILVWLFFFPHLEANNQLENPIYTLNTESFYIKNHLGFF